MKYNIGDAVRIKGEAYFEEFPVQSNGTIDWREYKSNLEISLENERLWELGCFDEYNPHSHNIIQIEKELSLIETDDYETILRMHDVEYFKDFMEG